MTLHHKNYRHVEPQKIQDRRTGSLGGIDYGGPGRILVEIIKDGKIISKLIWFKGHIHASSGVRGFGQDYSPAILTFTDKIGMTGEYLLEGGRLTRTRLEEVRDKIEKKIGKGNLELIDLKKTLEIAA